MKICFTGDSISHGVDSGIRAPRTIGDLIAFQIKNTQCRNICYPSDGIDEQTTRWNQISESEKLEFDYVISMNGNNDMNASTDVSTLMGEYHTFFDMIIADTKPSCKIIICTMTPAYDVYIAQGEAWLTKRNEINEALRNEGVNAINRGNAYVSEHTTYLDDGEGSLKEEYWNNAGDHLHTNVAGRIIIADAVVQKMRELKWI